MLLVSALLALSAPQAAPAKILEKEMLCVFDGLDEATLFKLAELGTDPDADAGASIVEVAAPAVEKCAVTWKWGKRGRVAGALTAAAYAGLMVQEKALEGRLDGKRLGVLFGKMSEADRHALTFDGSRTPPADNGKALNARFAAMLAREGVQQGDFSARRLLFHRRRALRRDGSDLGLFRQNRHALSDLDQPASCQSAPNRL